ncbi:MAG: hypothetical protein H7249_09480 [Chitinophagaceae bacterium]|nr:hypothetical protein [Oligoflexus sp.]
MQTAPYEIAPSAFTTMDGEAVFALTTSKSSALRQLNSVIRNADIRTYEGDLELTPAYRIHNGIKSIVTREGSTAPSFHVDNLFINPILFEDSTPEPIDLKLLALALETNADATRVLGLSLVTWHLYADETSEEVLIVGNPAPKDPWNVKCFSDEKGLLSAFRDRVVALDPDIITGWNVIDFDLKILSRLSSRYGIDLTLGRSRTPR